MNVSLAHVNVVVADAGQVIENVWHLLFILFEDFVYVVKWYYLFNLFVISIVFSFVKAFVSIFVSIDLDIENVVKYISIA